MHMIITRSTNECTSPVAEVLYDSANLALTEEVKSNCKHDLIDVDYSPQFTLFYWFKQIHKEDDRSGA